MREVSADRRGCTHGFAWGGCLLGVAAMVLPFSSCFGGGSISGAQAALALPLIAVTKLSFGPLLAIYLNAAAIVAFACILRGRIHGAAVLAILPAAVIPWFGAGSGVRIGYFVWAAAITVLAAGAAVLYLDGDPVPESDEVEEHYKE